MTGASLALFFALGQTPVTDPADLVPRLGAPRYAERERASVELERLGRRALPALRAARDLKDPEVRTRAATLVARIEGALLTKPTLVSLDFASAPIADVVKSIAEQTGVKVVLVPENSPNWAARRVTLHERSPLPFWKALDRVCEAGSLQYNYGAHTYANGREPTLPLFEGAGRPTVPVSDSGPFRVTVVGLHYQRDVSFPPAAAAPRGLPRGAGAGVGAVGRTTPMVNEQFYAQLQVAGEPRLALAQSGPLRIIEAVDEKGQALALPAADGAITQRASGYFGFTTGSVLPLQVPLTRPAQAGATIKRIKGAVPVTVSTRKPSPLVVVLGTAAGHTFQSDDVSLTVHDLRPPANDRPSSIELTVRPSGRAAGASASGFGGNDAVMLRPDTYQQQIEVTDAQGHPIPWYQTSFDAEAGRMTLTLTSANPAAPPAELRFYGLTRASAEVAFDFTDIPLP